MQRAIRVAFGVVGRGSGLSESHGVNLSLHPGDHRELLGLLDLLPAPSVIALDAKCAQLHMNRAFAALAGSAEDVLPMLALAIERGCEVGDLELDLLSTNGRAVSLAGSATALRDANGAVCGAVATFMDVTDRRSLEAMNEAARRERDEAAARLMYLAQAGLELSESLDLRAVLDTLGRILVPKFADCVSTTLIDEAGNFSISRIHHKDRDMRADMAALRERTNTNGPAGYPVAEEVLASGRAQVIADFGSVMAHPQADESYREYVRELSEVFKFSKAVVIPLLNRGVSTGVITVIGGPERVFSDDDIQLLEELGRRAASAVDNARTYERQRAVAQTLQQALLPASLPKLREVAFDAVYVPGGDEAQIGGDWYDAFMLSARRIAVSIGDVTGRGVDAAVLMGKVRQNIRALSLVEEDPAKLLDATDAAIRRNNPDLIVTALVGVLDLDTLVFRYATAGHPAPRLRRAGGVVLELPCYGLPLGLREEHGSTTVQIALHEGDLVTLFTDGLLESTHDLAEGERRIRVALGELNAQTLPDAAHAIRESVLFDGCSDDVAVISLRLSAGPAADALEWGFDARDGRLAHQSRGFFLQYLVERGVGGDDFAAAELVFGEMIGNVVRHAPGPVNIRVDWSGVHPVLEMTDEGGLFDIDANLPSDPLSEAGRGLFLVEALTKSFSVERIENRTRARAVLNLG